MHGTQKIVVPLSRSPQCKQFSNLAMIYLSLPVSIGKTCKLYTDLGIYRVCQSIFSPEAARQDAHNRIMAHAVGQRASLILSFMTSI
jgi:hypothetical protein